MDEMISRFLTSARAHSTRTAIQEEDRRLTYAELEAYVVKLAAAFHEVASCPRVLICCRQGIQSAAAELATRLAGGAFCPVDPATPRERAAHIARVFDPAVIWSDSPSVFEGDPRRLELQTTNGTELVAYDQSGDVAYVIFTSGSTGNPKGVPIRPSALPPFFRWLQDTYRPCPDDRWAQFSSPSFDLSIVDLFGALCAGASLHPVTSRRDRLLPGRFVANRGITIWHSVPSLIPALVEIGTTLPARLSSLRLASFCGEPLYEYHLRALFNACPVLEVYNTYGPTEATLFCSAQRITRHSVTAVCDDTAPIGQPIPGWRFELMRTPESLDDAELTINSRHISTGYVGEGVDNSSFECPKGHEDEWRFRTRDIVRAKEDFLYFVGRADRQVKVRGQRIELGEVEALATEFTGAEAHAVLEKGRVFLAVSELSANQIKDLGEALATRLPEAARPAAIVSVDSFPRLASGKIDTRTLLQRLSTYFT